MLLSSCGVTIYTSVVCGDVYMHGSFRVSACCTHLAAHAVRTWQRILSSALFLFELIAIIVPVSNDATQSKTKCRANTCKDLTQCVKSAFEHKKCRVAGIKSHHQMRTLRGSWRVCVQPQVAHLCSPVARQSE
jgi:hypothetical protein